MIAIPNMEKPKSCNECRYKMWTMNETFCNLLDKMLGDEDIRPDCPLIDIVTCGECKWGDMGIDEEGKLFWKCLGIHYGGTKPTDFCSYGERANNTRTE